MMAVSVSSISIIAIFTISWVDHNITNVVTADRAERLPPIETPLREHRQFRGIKLANGLQALLVNDPRARKSSAAMVVAVGSINDEKEEPGIANLVRYLLLSACQKYRQESEFKKYLEERGGKLTSELTTSEAEHKHHYAFEVDHDYLEFAIKRFAKHFIKPLFEKVDGVALRAALGHSLAKKHDRLMSTDRMRIAQVLKSISEEDHRYNNLSYGTVEMLNKYAGVDHEPLDDKLMNFVRKWYSANLMRLVVIGDEKLDVLEEVVTTSFSAIQNTDMRKLIFPYEQHPWTSDQLKHKLCIVPALNDSMREIRLTFPTPDVLSQYKISPEKYAIQFINHRGPGTLGFVLPDRGLCKSKSVRAEYQTYAGIAFFTIVMEPTEEGLKKVDRILELTFQYINLLKNEGVEDWFYDEEKTIDELNSSIIDEKFYTAQNLASAMHDISIGHIITYKYSRGPWDAEPVHKFLAYLTPNNVNISVIDKLCESAVNIRTEPWYGTKYQIERIPEGIIKKWASPTDFFPELKIPSHNEFMPDSPSDMDTSTFNGFIPGQPQIIHTSSISRIWYKSDYDFPLVQIALNIMSPIMNTSLLNHPFTDIYARILDTSLKEYEYSAERIGYSWDISVTPVGFEILLAGPVVNKLEAVLLEKILFRLSHSKDIVSEEIFEKCKKEVVSVLENRGTAKDSHQAAMLYLTHILINGTWTSTNVIRLPLQKELQRQKFENFPTKLLSRIHIQGLIYGTCDEEKAKVVANTIEETFKQTSQSALPQEMLNLSRRCVHMGSGKSFVYQSHGDSPEHVYHVFFQLGSRKTPSADIRHKMTVRLILNIIFEACWKILPPRVVGSSECRIDSIKQITGFVIIITSQMHPHYMDMRAERFLEIMREKLRDMSDEAFNSYKMRFETHHIMETDDDPTNVARFNYYLNEIRKGTYAFHRRSTELQKLEKLKKEDVIAFFKEIFAKGSSKRRKIAVYVYSNTLIRNTPRNMTADDDGMDSEDKLENTRIEDAVAFKNAFPLLPTPLPKMNLVLERQIDNMIDLN